MEKNTTEVVKNVPIMPQVRSEETKDHIRSLKSGTEGHLERGVPVLFCYSNGMFRFLRR